jgi:hypothetical protein
MVIMKERGNMRIGNDSLSIINLRFNECPGQFRIRPGARISDRGFSKTRSFYGRSYGWVSVSAAVSFSD